MKVDLGCGNFKKEGFIGVDVSKENTQADIAHDLSIYPWPFEDNSVDEFFSSHNFEHVPQMERGKYMDEAYRCLKPGGIFEVVTPYAWSHRSVQDFTHMWPPIVMQSYFYFDKQWRLANGMKHWAYDLKCDFKIEDCSYQLSEKEALSERTAEQKQERIQNNLNVVDDMRVILRKR